MNDFYHRMVKQPFCYVWIYQKTVQMKVLGKGKNATVFKLNGAK